MAIFRRTRRATPREPSTTAPDERIWGRKYAGLAPWTLGLLMVAVFAVLVFLAFAKKLPWSTPGYELHATFRNAATLRKSSPVRIAGVNVGKVTDVQAKGDAAEVTFTVDDEGRPIHEDAEIEIRPRLFLEGNFFLDLDPGSPSASELPDDGQIPITQTATAVQLDEVLTALQDPERKGLQRTLRGFGTALNYQPTPADDLTQDPAVAGESAGESLNDAFRYGARAGRGTAIVSRALRGQNPGDLAGFIRSTSTVFAKLASVDGDLGELITNLNVTAGALASESANLSATIAELAPTLDEAQVSLRDLSGALPEVRALAIASQPAIEELPDTIDAFEPWLDQTGALLTDSELGGLARQLRAAAPGLAETTAGSRELFPQLSDLARCSSENLIPTADTTITADTRYPTGQSNFNEFFYGAVALAGTGQGFDGNGPYLRLQPGGGPLLVHNSNPTGTASDQVNFTNVFEAPAGVQPALPGSAPPVRMDVDCFKNDVPNINGPAAAAAAPDLTP